MAESVSATADCFGGSVMNTITVAIADSDIIHASAIKEYIKNNYMGLEVLKLSCTGSELIDVIRSDSPDIVITDLVFPDMAEMEIIRRAGSYNNHVHIIILSNVTSFIHACEAIRLGVNAYILKSADRGELSLAVNRIINDITLDSSNSRGAESLRSYFFNEITRNPDHEKYSVDIVNRNYCTNFRPGLYRVMQIKLDFDSDADSFFNKTTRIFHDLRNILIADTKDSAYEIIPNEKYDGSFFLLNYAKENSAAIDDILYNRTMPKFSAYCSRFYNLHISIGLGGETEFFNLINNSEKEAAVATWARMQYGLDKIYRYSDCPNCVTDADVELMEQVKNSIYTAFILLDKESVKRLLDRLFSLPGEVKCSNEFKMAITWIRHVFFELFIPVLQKIYNTDVLAQKISYQLHMCQTFDAYHMRFVQLFSDLMDAISQLATTPKSSYVKEAIKRIDRDYQQAISLNQVAEELNITPVYLSSLFSKEVGQSFVQYLNNRRIQTAKRLLRRTNLSVNEICDRVGFSEPRYFSRVFRKQTGYTPSDYRKSIKDIP